MSKLREFFPDGTIDISGYNFPLEVLLDDDYVTIDMIAKEKNIEARRILIQCMGLEKFLSNCPVTDDMLDEDGECFLEVPITDDVSMKYARVVNGTVSQKWLNASEEDRKELCAREMLDSKGRKYHFIGVPQGEQIKEEVMRCAYADDPVTLERKLKTGVEFNVKEYVAWTYGITLKELLEVKVRA